MRANLFSTVRPARNFRLIVMVAVGLAGAFGRAHASQSVELTWTPSPSPDVVAYNVHFGTHSRSYSDIVTFDSSAVTWSGIGDVTIPGLEGGSTYFFAVSAVDTNADESVFSEEAAYTVPAPPALTLQAQASSVAALAADLTWTPSAESDVYTYVVQYGRQPVALTNSEIFYYATSGTVTGLVAGATYYFRVEPIDTYGAENAAGSSPVSSTIAQPPPIVLQAQPSASAGLAVDVSWNPSPLTGVYAYEVRYSAQGSGQTNLMEFYYSTGGTVPRLTPGTNYFFTVSPVDYFGVEGIVSPRVSCMVTSPPPLALQAQADPSNPRAVLLVWEASPESAVYGYTIYFGTQKDNLTDSTFSASTSASISWLPGGTNYYFAVMADDIYGGQYGLSNVAAYAVRQPAPMLLKTQITTDGNGQPALMHIYTPTVVNGWWELEFSYDLQNWYGYTSGYGLGAGDGTDLQYDIGLGPTQPPMFFRAINY